jgi:hypothetical protein
MKGIVMEIMSISTWLRAWATSPKPLRFRQALWVATLSNALGLLFGTGLVIFDSAWARPPFNTPTDGAAAIIPTLAFAVLAAGAIAPAIAVGLGLRLRPHAMQSSLRRIFTVTLEATAVLLGELICAFALCSLLIIAGIATGDHEGGWLLLVLLILAYAAAAIVPGGIACATGIALGWNIRVNLNVDYPTVPARPDGNPPSKKTSPAGIWRWWGMLALAVLQISLLLVFLRSIPSQGTPANAEATSSAYAPVVALVLGPLLVGDSCAIMAATGIALLLEPRAGRGERITLWLFTLLFVLWSMHMWNLYWWL